MRRLAKEGKNAIEISKILHSSPETVRKYASDILITPKNTIKGNEELIIRLYQEGYTQKDIAEQLGIYNTSVRRVLLRNNITIRNNSEINRYCNVNPFQDGD